MADEDSPTEPQPGCCAMCDYDLTGLPRAHKCPECGFEYDDELIVLPCFVTKKPSPLSHALMAFGIVVAGTLVTLIVSAIPVLPTLTTIVLMAGLVILASIWIPPRLLGPPKPAGRLIIGRGRLGFRTRIADLKAITPWSGFQGVAIRRIRRRMHRIELLRSPNDDGKTPLPARFFFHATPEKAAELRDRLQERIDEAATPADSGACEHDGHAN